MGNKINVIETLLPKLFKTSLKASKVIWYYHIIGWPVSPWICQVEYSLYEGEKCSLILLSKLFQQCQTS